MVQTEECLGTENRDIDEVGKEKSEEQRDMNVSHPLPVLGLDQCFLSRY